MEEVTTTKSGNFSLKHWVIHEPTDVCTTPGYTAQDQPQILINRFILRMAYVFLNLMIYTLPYKSLGSIRFLGKKLFTKSVLFDKEIQ